MEHASGFVVDNLDQAEARSRVFVNRVRSGSAGSEDFAGIDFNQLNRTKVDVFDSGAGGNGRTTGYRVRAGTEEQSHTMAVWTSTMLGNGTDLWVTNGPEGVRALFSSIYMEKSAQFLRVEGPGGTATGSDGRPRLHRHSTLDTPISKTFPSVVMPPTTSPPVQETILACVFNGRMSGSPSRIT